jgi:multiple sugar transport system ATP-binding protein
MAGVSFDDVVKTYADGTTAVSHLSLEIEDGEFMVLVGPSGCGKTTALRMLAGLETITSGAIFVGDRMVNHLAPKDRDIAMVFQNYALYPHLSVYENIAFSLRLRKVSKDEVDKRVHEAARTLGLEQYLDRKPRALSGGQRQRVAMGRAIVRKPHAFLMDEPLSNLDAKLRVQMRSEISRLQTDLGVTTIYVTHDQVEAMTMGDRVAVMRRGGELQQVAPPQVLYDKPVNLFVAGFIGSPTMNMLEAHVDRRDGGLLFAAGDQRIVLPGSGAEGRAALSTLEKYVGRTVILGVRPEDLEDVKLKPDTPQSARLHGKVVLTEKLGSEILAHFRVAAPPVLTEDTEELAKDTGLDDRGRSADAESSILLGRFSPRSRVRQGQEVEAAVDLRTLHFFDPESGLGVYDDQPVPLRIDTAERDAGLARKEVG